MQAAEADEPSPDSPRSAARSSIDEGTSGAAGAVELAVLEEWEAKELADPTDPWRVFGLSSAASFDEVEKKYRSKMEMYELEGGAKEGSSRLLWLRAKYAYELLASEEKKAAFVARRQERIRAGTWAKLRYANGLYEGSVDLDDEVPLRTGRGVMLMATGEKYDGEFDDDTRHGVGLCFWQNGDLYVGQWRVDMMSGRGCYYYGTGVRYAGEFDDGRRHGAGRQVWPDGSTYNGNFERGLRSGHGVLQLKRQRGKMSPGSYDGQWREGEMEGFGTYVGKEDCSYEGQFQSNRFHGQGTLRLPSGDIYKGTFVNGMREGEGEYEWPDKEKYVGSFKDNRPEGDGSFSSSLRGLEFVGQWRSGHPQGHCTVTQQDIGTGNVLVYSGQCERGRREGQGEMVWPKGGHYTGAFRADRPHGPGVLEFADHSSWDGTFVKGARDGAGVFRTVQEDGQAGEERVEIWHQGVRGALPESPAKRTLMVPARTMP